MRFVMGSLLLMVGSPLLAVPFMEWEGTDDLVARVLVTSFVVAMGGLGCYLGGRMLRRAFLRPPTMEVGPEALTIRHGAVLRAPVAINRSQISAVSVRRDPKDSFWDPERFDIAVDYETYSMALGPDQVAELLDTASDHLVPVITHVDSDDPNVMIVFDRLVNLPARRRALTNYLYGRHQRPSAKSEVRAVALCVENPEAAHEVFSAWVVPTKLDIEHHDLIVPSGGDQRRASWMRIARYAALGYFLLVVLSAVLNR